MNVSRALTRLKCIFVSMSISTGHEVNNFWHPMEGNYDHDKELKFECQIGSKKFPEYPIRSSAEAFYQLRKALGVHDINAQMDINAKTYRQTKYVLGVDLEKILGASFSGYNSKSGDLLTLKQKQLGTAALQNSKSYKMHYCLHYDSIMNIRDAGVECLE